MTKARTVLGTVRWRVYVNLFLLLSCQLPACPDRLKPGGGQVCCLPLRDVKHDMHPQTIISENSPLKCAFRVLKI